MDHLYVFYLLHVPLKCRFVKSSWLLIERESKQNKLHFMIDYKPDAQHLEGFFSTQILNCSIEFRDKVNINICFEQGFEIACAKGLYAPKYIYANSVGYRPNLPLSDTSHQISRTKQIIAHKIYFFLTYFSRFFVIFGKKF